MWFLEEGSLFTHPNSCPFHSSNTPWLPEPHTVTQERSGHGVSAEAGPRIRRCVLLEPFAWQPPNSLSSSFPVFQPKSIPCCFIYSGHKHPWQHSSVDRQVSLSSSAQLVPLCRMQEGATAPPRPQKAAQHCPWLHNASHLTCLSLSWVS